MDWDLPAIVLNARPYGDADVIATVITAEHGAHRGLVRAGAARAHAGLWQTGNFIQARWTGRLVDQLGYFRAELVHATAASVLDDPLGLAMLTSVCALAEDALPEREPHPAVFQGLVALLPRLMLGAEVLGELIRWELTLLADLGYGLDVSRCTVTGATEDLGFVSPRTGRAVARAAAGGWESRLLILPGFLTGGETAGPADWRDGLLLTGHFLARDVFGVRHRPLPMARTMLFERVVGMVEEG